ncbi:hypothetical protein EVAR_18763_1 [Eumeta japonica]|uniref:Uncharacterized protein n=1 Tax=Eumeta variegata TaxID=151549 RepID=A0A4C1UMB1_EUMVA|nr:hypothetical protein EVAR_18763_1 [Eumeta japonica]
MRDGQTGAAPAGALHGPLPKKLITPKGRRLESSILSDINNAATTTVSNLRPALRRRGGLKTKAYGLKQKRLWDDVPILNRFIDGSEQCRALTTSLLRRLPVREGILSPTLMYGSENWMRQKKNESRIIALDMRSLRSMCEVSPKETLHPMRAVWFEGRCSDRIIKSICKIKGCLCRGAHPIRFLWVKRAVIQEIDTPSGHAIAYFTAYCTVNSTISRRPGRGARAVSTAARFGHVVVSKAARTCDRSVLALSLFTRLRDASEDNVFFKLYA